MIAVNGDEKKDLGNTQLYVSVNSKPDHILVAPGVAPMSCPGGGLESKEKFDNFEKSAIFALSLKQKSNGSFYMFIHVRSEQYDLIGGFT